MSSLYLRQQDIVDQPRLASTPITVIGAGAIGSFVVLGLAKSGALDITVWDHDSVAVHNLSNQWFRPSDVGRLKVDALGELVAEMTGTEVSTVPAAFDGTGPTEITALRRSGLRIDASGVR